MGKVLRGVRWGKVWLVSHNTQHAAEPKEWATARPVENEDLSAGTFDREEPPTLSSMPVCTVEWRPDDAEPFAIIDLLSSGPGIVRCKTLHEAEQKARRAV